MNKNVKQVLLELIRSSSAEEICSLLNTNSFFKNIKWVPIGGDDTNFTTINNQQEDPINALVEKPINSIDHLLLKEARICGIDPEGSDAPKTMREAVEKFFNIKEGDISKIDLRKRQNLAKNIRIIADGSLKQPSIAIVDFAEGQHPSEFTSTFLSLPRGKSNKVNIPFVQGRFNQGGTGALWFCGGDKFQLILSRKDPQLVNKNIKNEWGFTLIRLRPYSLVPKEKDYTWWEYFTDENENIFSFPGENLKILPEKEEMRSGSYLKLYSYDFGRYSASSILLDLWRELNRKLFAPALPIMLYEGREFKTELHGRSRILIGNKYRTIKEDTDKVCKVFSFDSDLGKLGKRKIEVTVFIDKDKNGKPFRGVTREFATDEEAIFLTINGQTHKTEPRSFFKKREFSSLLDFLADYLMVHIDLTNMPREIRDELVFASRDRFRKGEIYNQFIERLTSDLKENNILRRLNDEYKARFLANIQPDRGEVKKIIGRILKRNRYLSRWLNLGNDISLPPLEPLSPAKFEPVYPPTEFKLKVPEGANPPYFKDFPINYKYVWLQFKTNAADDYFSSERGGKIIINTQTIKHSEYLDHGTLWLKIYRENDASVGESKEIIVSLVRLGMEPLKEKLNLRYIKEREPGVETPPLHGFDFVPPSIRIKEGQSRNATIKVLMPAKIKDEVTVELKSNSKFIEIASPKIKLSEAKAIDGIVSKNISVKGERAGIKGKVIAQAQNYNFIAELEVEVISESIGDERTLPEIKGLNKDEWEQHAGSSWSENKIVEVKGDVILVNMDAISFHEYLSQNSKISKKGRENLEEFYKLGIGLNALVLDLELKEYNNGNKQEIFDRSMRAVARVLLPINTYGRDLITSPEDIM